ncbi:pitrilysin family protein [Herbidospora sp. NBRC 101105]|uniref:M16 family metallopeptidase n=1 Tax=Herbidospora sp. NBRC 101105 TaxID=3032195 RepID=UPI0024A180B5|nr:pitrilysin family protein [Herbidospora sp. NBRC 101105]GLX98298.1 zinc protease [Herbidospora sp. NBRC 101105]
MDGLLTRRLPGGATLIVRPDPGLGFVAVNAWHGAGSLHDPAGRSGLAHVVEHVMSEGGSAHATTGYECTNYVATGPPTALPALLAEAGDRVRRGRRGVRADVLDGHRRIVLEEIRERDEPGRFGSGLRRGLRLLFGRDHPAGRPPVGDPAEVAAVTPDDVAAFVEAHYGAERLVVSVVGAADPDAAVELAGNHLAGLPSGRPAPPPVTGEPLGAREDVEEGQPTSMVRLTFALPPGSAAAEVVMAALASAPWSVLGSRPGLLGALGQHARCALGPAIGLVKLSAPAAADLAGLERDVAARLAAVARDGLPPDVLAAAKALRIREQLGVLGAARTLAEELCREHAWSGDAAGVTARLDAVRRVTNAEVAALAAGPMARPSVVAFHAAGEPSWIL